MASALTDTSTTGRTLFILTGLGAWARRRLLPVFLERDSKCRALLVPILLSPTTYPSDLILCNGSVYLYFNNYRRTDYYWLTLYTIIFIITLWGTFIICILYIGSMIGTYRAQSRFVETELCFFVFSWIIIVYFATQINDIWLLCDSAIQRITSKFSIICRPMRYHVLIELREKTINVIFWDSEKMIAIGTHIRHIQLTSSYVSYYK